MKKIAIVYDWLDKWGGVERVLLTLHEVFPTADFYTSYYDKNKARWAKDFHIKTSFLQKLPRFIREHRVMSLPLYPFAFESFNFSEYDCVISVTSSFAKGVVTRPETRHLCYLLTPTRFLWSHQEIYLKNSVGRFLTAPYVKQLRQWDYVAAERPDKIIAISQTVAERCKKYYERDSEVLYPPFDLSYWEGIKKQLSSRSAFGGFGIPGKKNEMLNPPKADQHDKETVGDKKYFLIVSRLEKYKRVDLVLDCFNNLPDQNLIVVGKGTEEQKLRSLAKSNTQFLKDLSDEELGQLYMHAEALIMPQEEDFGYVALEAQFFGCPVIAFNAGGAQETVIDGKTGILFEKQDLNSLRHALERFHTISYNLRTSTQISGPENVQRFEKSKFENKCKEILNIK